MDGPVEWSHQYLDNSFQHVPDRFCARFDVAKTDGTFQALTTQLAETIFEDKNDEASIYTYHLRIEAEIIQIRFTPSEEANDNIHEYTVSTTKDVNLVWTLIPTPIVTAHDDLHQALREQTFDCVIFNNKLGLVVGTHCGKTERVGMIPVQGKLLAGWEPWAAGRHLRDFFPGERREITIG
jgi:hypothetical protein